MVKPFPAVYERYNKGDFTWLEIDRAEFDRWHDSDIRQYTDKYHSCYTVQETIKIDEESAQVLVTWFYHVYDPERQEGRYFARIMPAVYWFANTVHQDNRRHIRREFGIQHYLQKEMFSNDKNN